jgi:hypothetical protein
MYRIALFIKEYDFSLIITSSLLAARIWQSMKVQLEVAMLYVPRLRGCAHAYGWA